MMTDSPAAVANRAARSLLPIPPVPSELRVSPAMPMTERSMLLTVAIFSAFGSSAGIAAEKPINHCQQNEQRGLQKIGDHGGEMIVVAKLDLRDAHRVVFIDDRQHAPFEKC